MTPDSDGPPILLVHGFATSANRTWRETGWIDLFEEAGRTVIAPDLLGHGDADKPHDVEPYSAVEAQVAAQLPGDGVVDAIGYSAGARVVLALAAQNPGRFRRIVVGGLGGTLFERREGNPILDALEGRGSEQDMVGAHFRSMAEGDGNDPQALAAFIQREQPRLDREDVAKISCPTLVIIGDQDFAGPGEPLAETLPAGQLKTLRNVDHFGLPKSISYQMEALEFVLN